MPESHTKTIAIPPYLTVWDLDDEISRCMRIMRDRSDTYLLDMSRVRNIYSATVRLIMRLHDRAERQGARIYLINTPETTENALRMLEVDSRVPILSNRPAAVLAA